MTPEELIEKVGDLLRRFHRDSCYPDAMNFEVAEAARAAIAIVVEECAWIADEYGDLPGRAAAAKIRALLPKENEP